MWRLMRNRRFQQESLRVIQAAGHGNFQRLSETIIVKEGSEAEARAHESILRSDLAPFIPQCFHTIKSEKHTMLYIEDLTMRYSRPCVMDIKMGVRTFLESELTKSKPRVDLAKKVMDIDPTLLTKDERTDGITKLRYMQVREELSSTSRLGLRIEGIRLATGEEIEVRRTLREPEEIRSKLEQFVQSRADVGAAFLVILEKLRSALEASNWFHGHELVSSSLLFIYDDNPKPTYPPKLWMIDFGKTKAASAGRRLDHRLPWQPSNGEDGYLLGMDSLCQLFSGVGKSPELGDDGRPAPAARQTSSPLPDGA
jgi:1D-myo-inositol-triphosphate 3-kinase